MLSKKRFTLFRHTSKLAQMCTPALTYRHIRTPTHKLPHTHHFPRLLSTSTSYCSIGVIYHLPFLGLHHLHQLLQHSSAPLLVPPNIILDLIYHLIQTTSFPSHNTHDRERLMTEWTPYVCCVRTNASYPVLVPLNWSCARGQLEQYTC